MANIPIWPGSSSFADYLVSPGNPTPFGFYDSDTSFQSDADKVSKFCAQRLGYPIENVELQDIQFWTAFEEAVTVYGNELYAFKVRDNMLSLEGATTGSSLNHTLITPNMSSVVRLSEQYGEEAGVGGNVNWYSGSIALTASIQDYDLTDWAVSQSITGGIEIKRVFFQAPPAVNEMYTPYAGGFGFDGDAAAFAFMGGGYGYGDNFLMMPLSYDMQTIQAIEMSNQVRLSNYTFELINNKLRVFPVPTNDDVDIVGGYRSRIWFQYIKNDDRINAGLDNDAGDKITNESNVPFNNPTYEQINSIGRSWIFEYTLAIVKETLGYVRGKYSTIPIPGADVTLNQGDLISAATTEKEALITRLREYFDQTSRQSLLERRAAESVARKSELGESPMTIYIG
jgi:hypothetical protein